MGALKLSEGAVDAAEGRPGGAASAGAAGSHEAGAAPPAAAFEAGFGALARLLERGPVGQGLELARAHPSLAPTLGDDPEQAEAEHERAFGREAMPLAGLYLNPQGQAGDVEGMVPLFESIGLPCEPSSCGIDHGATQLRALAWLAGAEAEAARDGDALAVLRCREAQRRLLDEHVLRWLPVWALAVQRLPLSWPSALAEQVLELVLLRRSGLPQGDVPSWDLPPLPDLDDPQTDLRSIAEALTLPSTAGLLFTRCELQDAARGAQAPSGFGPRRLMLINALRSAANFDSLSALCGGLQEVALQQITQVRRLEERGVPGLAEALAPWRERACQTLALLDRLMAG